MMSCAGSFAVSSRQQLSSAFPFHRMAILYRMETPYASLISEELRMAGIPMAGPTRGNAG